MADPAAAFRPCAVIPVYNHGRTVGATVAGLRALGLHAFVVDDGSAADTRDALDALAAHEGVKLLRLEVNQGKGRAVSAGLAAARAAGYSHALQIDADGQHALADVPAFLDAGRRQPRALVCGAAVYDASVPRARLYGRYVTHVCVWAETLSLAIRDSMCGFRLYPLADTCALIDGVRLPARMDFDTEIAVRLVWRGLPVVNLPTPVSYPADGLSHFRMLRDNLRISAMHTRLLLGMLPRLPQLLWRRLRRPPACAA